MFVNEKILKEYYKIILLFVTQMMLLTLFVTHNFMKAHVYIPTRVQNVIEITMGILIFALCLVSIFVVKKLYRTALEQHMHQVHELKYKNIEEQNKIYRQHKHDLVNHLSILSVLAKEGRYVELDQYVSYYQEEVNSDMISVNTGIREMDILVYSKIRAAQHKNIQVIFECSTVLECKQRFVLNLIAILGNLLDNAIEAAQDAKSKEIHILINEDPIDYVFIIQNTFSGDMMALQHLVQEGISTKGQDRGQGLWIVSQLVDKFAGKITLKEQEGRFEARVELPKHKILG